MTKLTLDDLARAACGAQGWAPEEPSGTDCSIARAILTTIHEAGYRIVPVEATAEMAEAGKIRQRITENNQSLGRDGIAKSIWQAMLSASPKIKDTDLDQ